MKTLSFNLSLEEFSTLIKFSKNRQLIRSSNQITWGVQNFCIDVTRKEKSPVPTGSKEKMSFFKKCVDEYSKKATIAMNRLLDYFKYYAGHSSLQPIDEQTMIDCNPSWFDEKGNKYQHGMHYDSATFYILDDYQIKNETFHVDSLEELSSHLIKPRSGLLQDELLSDAKSALKTHNYRRTVIEAAVACEVAAKHIFFGGTKASAAAFEYMEDKQMVRAKVLDLLDGVSLKAFGVGLRSYDPKAFLDLDMLIRCRNKVVHRGVLSYRDDKGQEHKVDYDSLTHWLRSVDRIFEWLSTLGT